RAIVWIVDRPIRERARPRDVVPLPDVLGLIVEPLDGRRYTAEYFVRASDVELIDVRPPEARIRIRQRHHSEVGRHLPEINLAAGRQIDTAKVSLRDVVAVEIGPGGR